VKKNLEMMSSDIIKENIDYIAKKFPNALKEVIEDGKVVNKIDFDVLKQELSTVVIDDRQERYQMTWPDKKKSILLANSRINGTLRPLKEKSVDFENTENLYIEGDNLDVLKLLRETYLGKIKMIYIDPPYNTGTDLVYEDDFVQSSEDYLSNSGQYDDQGNKLIQNTDSNGRFHTDWLNMMYPRLKLSRDLLSENGAIFISIDENEEENLKKICNEIFGENNKVGTLIRKTKSMTADKNTGLNLQHESLLIYSKNKNNIFLKGEEKDFSNYSNPDNDPNGPWVSADPTAKSGGESTYFPIINPITNEKIYPSKGRFWAFSQETLIEYIKNKRIVFNDKGTGRGFIFKRYLHNLENRNNPLNSLDFVANDFMNQSATKELNELFGEYIFDYPKPVKYIKSMVSAITDENDIILDFFSGSATTAHAVMQINADDGKNRKFIMIQIPEPTNEKSTAYKEGYKNISEIGQDRIIKAGKIIKKESGALGQNLDIGFRVLKLDTSNMNDVFYNPANLSQNLLDQLVGNVKEDRTPLDLLFQVMLELGIELSAKIEEKELLGKKYFVVNENDIVACFDDGISDGIVTELAKIKPIYVVFKDSSFESDSANINSEQIFRTISPSTRIKVI
jgi:adenine-specific DNA-methyltransferase